MKTKILTSMICVCSLFKMQAQVFPTSDAIWSIQMDYWETIGVWPEQELRSEVLYYGLSGDTIINEMVYNKLYLLNDTTLNIDSDDEYIGGFRQEEKKVWFRPSFPPFYPSYDYLPYPEETLLYDFSKNVGDTIWHNSISGSYYWTMKDSIATSIITAIDIDEQRRIIYHTSSTSGRPDSWIEGIGSVERGLFWFLSSMSSNGGPYFHLTCFKQGDEIKYINKDYCSSCFSCSPADILEKNNISLEIIHENNNIWIKGESSLFPCELKLFSPAGHLILERKLQSGSEKIPVNQLKGICLYQLKKDREILNTGKIMIK